MADNGQGESEEHISVDQLTPEEANRIIHFHRKVRYGTLSCAEGASHSLKPPSGTACWPCRQRKVKCDNKQPCENCVKREYPQLCSYKPNRSSHGKSTSVLPDTVISKKRARSFSDARKGSRKADRQDSWPRTIGTGIYSVPLFIHTLTS